MNNEADTLGLILGLLYEHRGGGVVVKPDFFAPPIAKRNIHLIGSDFYEDGIIANPPSETGHGGYFMHITLRGRALWEGKEQCVLDITVPPK